MREMLAKLDTLTYVPVEDIRKIDPQLLTLRNINTEQDFTWATKIIQTSPWNKDFKHSQST
jgi:hypothetical protein